MDTELTPIFCYGSNHPAQIANRLNLEIEEVFERVKPCKILGYKRAFMNTSARWGGKSVGTIVEDEHAVQEAFAFYMTPEQVKIMDGYENVPVLYERVDVNLLDKEGNEFRGQVYKMHQSDVFSYPSTDYLRACAFTSMAYHYLNPCTKDYNFSSILFEVWDCAHNVSAGDFEWKDIEYPKGIQKVIDDIKKE